MKKKIVALMAGAMLMMTTSAFALTWVKSPDGNSAAGSVSVITGLKEFVNLASDTDSQAQGIFGAGFKMTGTSASVKFDSDLNTWDSYNKPTVNGTGWYDAFIVTISTQDYYWNLPNLVDPIANNASTFVWGGKNWNDGILDSYITAPGKTDTISMNSAIPTTFFVSFVLDTKTLPYSDTAHPSWGTFHVEAVPEPGTMVLLGAGLLGLAVFGKRRMNKEA